MAPTLPTYEDTRKVGPNLFQELSADETDGYSSVDDRSAKKDGFKLPRSEKKREKSEKKEEKKKENDEKSKPEETKKDKDNPKVEAMKAGRGTIKRAQTAKSESEEDPNDEVATLKEVIKTMSARFKIAKDQMAKKDEDNQRLRAEIKKMSNRSPLDTSAKKKQYLKKKNLGRKRQRDPSVWKINVLKKLGNSGQEYTGKTGILSKIRELGPGCNDKCIRKC
uniref:UPF0329 protein ECU05_1680/ECU11_0050-like n=1 Tax=Diabrotica virgifera virgifera TaxID=50390 RepID=A0A6P7G5Q9_DIAVI